MYLVDATNAADYLRSIGKAEGNETVRVKELAGGVSNVVLQVRIGDESTRELILKQSRPQLRVAEPWFCDVKRIWREIDVLRAIGNCLTSSVKSTTLLAAVPRLLFEDRENYLFAMTPAPAPHETWKQQLLSDKVNDHIVEATAEMLARIHATSWADCEFAKQLGEIAFFRDLRIDPYFSSLASKHSDLSAHLEAISHGLLSSHLAIVHGDFSPKNLLVHSHGIMLVDMEVGHFGDPAFDVGFLLSHLVLKGLRSERVRPRCIAAAARFWDEYFMRMSALASELGPSEDDLKSLSLRAIDILSACMLARVDGKSPVDYLDEPERVRKLARRLLAARPNNWEQFEQMLQDRR